MPEFTSYGAGVPCWVDVTSPELDRTVSFYSDLFGWAAEQDPRPEAGGYTMFTKNGKYVSAASPPAVEGMPAHWTTYIASDDVDATAARVTEVGGTLFMNWNECRSPDPDRAGESYRIRSAPSSA